ncbi:MAG: hypothetical protein K2K28_00215, partial [Clostridia bacterium]|nr:hypothetical protein [Clostridia bacterium]
YAELCKILDLNDGDALSGGVAEKYFSDCVKKLELKNIDREIASLKAKIKNETSTETRKSLTMQLQQVLNKRKN